MTTTEWTYKGYKIFLKRELDRAGKVIKGYRVFGVGLYKSLTAARRAIDRVVNDLDNGPRERKTFPKRKARK